MIDPLSLDEGSFIYLMKIIKIIVNKEDYIMNKYFIYFSASGNGDFIAEYLKERGYTPLRVEMVKPIKKINFFSIMKYGFRAGLEKKEKIKDLELDLKEDDEVIIGSPIWNDRLSTPINSLLAKYEFNKESTKFIVYPAGETAKKVITQLEKLGFKQIPIVFSNPLKNRDKIENILK